MPESKYQPLIADETVSVSSSSTVVDIGPCLEVRLIPTSGTANIYFNSLTNSPPWILEEGVTFQNIDGQIKKVIISNLSGAASVNVKQIITVPGLAIRA